MAFGSLACEFVSVLSPGIDLPTMDGGPFTGGSSSTGGSSTGTGGGPGCDVDPFAFGCGMGGGGAGGLSGEGLGGTAGEGATGELDTAPLDFTSYDTLTANDNAEGSPSSLTNDSHGEPDAFGGEPALEPGDVE